jgi:hypothetical protein
MYEGPLDKPVPVPDPWPKASFRYYNYTCKIMNYGGHRNALELREKYRHHRIAIRDYWHAYMGVWWVFFNDKMVLVTPSLKEALAKFEKLKDRCITLRYNDCTPPPIKSPDFDVNQYIKPGEFSFCGTCGKWETLRRCHHKDRPLCVICKYRYGTPVKVEYQQKQKEYEEAMFALAEQKRTAYEAHKSRNFLAINRRRQGYKPLFWMKGKKKD